jgi:hypothetical protein
MSDASGLDLDAFRPLSNKLLGGGQYFCFRWPKKRRKDPAEPLTARDIRPITGRGFHFFCLGVSGVS